MLRALSRVTVHRLATAPTMGRLIAGGVAYDCVIGRGGRVVDKREGDGGTPVAVMRLRRVFLRLDRGPRIPAHLPVRVIGPADAWCDDPADRRYNRLIRRPPGEATERLMRGDRLYDVIVELGWNDAPVRRGRGSAIFWHVCRPGKTPTAGCVAVEPAVFRKLLPRLSRNAVMRVR